jgi:hypothetical protein
VKVTCPNCHSEFHVHGLGRKKLPIGVNNVCDALKTYPTITAAASALGCSRGYIYKVLQDSKLTLAQIIGKNVCARA